MFCLPTCLLSIIGSFSCVYISQGSVATQLECGRIFNNHLVANCPQNASVKNFENQLIFGEGKSGTFFGTQCSSNKRLETFFSTKTHFDIVFNLKCLLQSLSIAVSRHIKF